MGSLYLVAPWALIPVIFLDFVLAVMPSTAFPLHPGRALGILAVDIGAAILVVVLAVALRSKGTATGSNHASYQGLKARIEADTNLLPKAAELSTSPESPDGQTILKVDSRRARDAAEASLKKATELLDGELTSWSQWAEESGYVQAWQYVLDAEEWLVLCQPIGALVEGAYDDIYRLDGSVIDGAADRIAEVHSAIAALVPAAARYAKTGTFEPVVGVDQPLARVVLRQTRNLINNYRQKQYDGLIDTRNRFMVAVIGLGLVTIVLELFALFAGADPKLFPPAGALFVVGVAAGFFARLVVGGTVAPVVGDYGLAMVRLLLTPLTSGLGGLFGTLFAAAGPQVLQMIKAESTADMTKALTDFNVATALSLVPATFVAAAAFGAFPEVLLAGLKSAGDRFANRLESSSTAGSGTDAAKTDKAAGDTTGNSGDVANSDKSNGDKKSGDNTAQSGNTAPQGPPATPPAAPPSTAPLAGKDAVAKGSGSGG